MERAAYNVKIGSRTFDSASSQEIIRIRVDLDMAIPSDSFELAMKTGNMAGDIRVGDPVSVELGYEGATTRVITGSVDSINVGLSEVLVKGLSPVSRLTKARVNQVYENQTAGAIVKDLAGRAGLTIKSADDGLSLPMYVVDDGKNAYTHMRELSDRCGFDLYLESDGRLVFKKYSRNSPIQFKYGQNLIEAELMEHSLPASGVQVYGESPSSFKGSDTAHWLSKRGARGGAFVLTETGSEGTLVFVDPVVRDDDTAANVATAILERIRITTRGYLKALGDAGLGLGDTIEIKEMPDTRMNGEFQAVKVSHIFSKDEGFVSLVEWAKR